MSANTVEITLTMGAGGLLVINRRMNGRMVKSEVYEMDNWRDADEAAAARQEADQWFDKQSGWEKYYGEVD